MSVLNLPYTGGVPTLNSTKTLFDSTVSDQLGGRPMQAVGYKRYKASFKNDQPFTLKAYASSDNGVTWAQFAERYVPPSTTREMNNYEFNLDQHRHLKVTLVQGTAQGAGFYLGQSLTDDLNPAGSGSDAYDYIVNGDMETDITGPALKVGPNGQVTFFIQTTATDAPEGQLRVLGSMDGARFVELPSATAKLPAAGALAAQNIAVELEVNVDLVKLSWDNTSAGTGTGALLNVQARSR